MSTIAKRTNKPVSKFIGIAERKKAELDSLARQVLNAQQQVDQYQAIVISLTAKLNNFQSYLVDADSKRAQALSNKKLIDDLVNMAKDLKENTIHEHRIMEAANEKGNTLAAQVKDLIDKLIFTTELINKLGTLVVRQKSLNPLISDDLVDRLSKAGTDANNAVALTLVAMKAAFAAQASNTESVNATQYVEFLSNDFFKSLAVEVDSTKKVPKRGKIDAICLQQMLHAEYEASKKKFTLAINAVDETTRQLNAAMANLSTAQVNLNSLQSGLAAANAAALAS